MYVNGVHIIDIIYIVLLTSDTSAIAGFPRFSDVPVKSNMSSIIFAH